MTPADAEWWRRRLEYCEQEAILDTENAKIWKAAVDNVIGMLIDAGETTLRDTWAPGTINEKVAHDRAS